MPNKSRNEGTELLGPLISTPSPTPTYQAQSPGGNAGCQQVATGLCTFWLYSPWGLGYVPSQLPL